MNILVTGISGRMAQVVAEKMALIAGHRQVICVTHLPQIAAMGDTHMLIAKSERDGRTYTTVTHTVLNRNNILMLGSYTMQHLGIQRLGKSQIDVRNR